MKTFKSSFIILISVIAIITVMCIHRYRIVLLNEYEICNDSLKELLTEYLEHEEESPNRKYFTISTYPLMDAGSNYVRILSFPLYDSDIGKISSGYIRLNNTNIIVLNNHLQGNACLSLMRMIHKRPFVVYSGNRWFTTRAEKHLYENAESSYFKNINGQWKKSNVYDTHFEEEKRQHSDIDSLKYVFPIEPDFENKYDSSAVYESSDYIADWLKWSKEIAKSAVHTKVNDLCKAIYKMYHRGNSDDTKLILSLVEVRKYPGTFDDYRPANIDDCFFGKDFILQSTERFYTIPYFDVGKEVLYTARHTVPQKVKETLNYKDDHSVFSISFFADGALIATQTDSIEGTMEYVNYDAIFVPNKSKIEAHEIGRSKIHFELEIM